MAEVENQILEVQVEAVVVVEDHQVVHTLEVQVTLLVHLQVKAIMVVLVLLHLKLVEAEELVLLVQMLLQTQEMVVMVQQIQ